MNKLPKKDLCPSVQCLGAIRLFRSLISSLGTFKPLLPINSSRRRTTRKSLRKSLNWPITSKLKSRICSSYHKINSCYFKISLNPLEKILHWPYYKELIFPTSQMIEILLSALWVNAKAIEVYLIDWLMKKQRLRDNSKRQLKYLTILSLN